jgi:hypothetical protein
LGYPESPPKWQRHPDAVSDHPAGESKCRRGRHQLANANCGGPTGDASNTLSALHKFSYGEQVLDLANAVQCLVSLRGLSHRHAWRHWRGIVALQFACELQRYRGAIDQQSTR